MGTIDISLENKFDEPVDILRIEFATFGKCLSFIWNSTAPGKLIVQPNQTYRVTRTRKRNTNSYKFCLDW
mgnify:CR=1 FL=1